MKENKDVSLDFRVCVSRVKLTEVTSLAHFRNHSVVIVGSDKSFFHQ